MEKIGFHCLLILMLCYGCQSDKSPLRLAVAANLLAPVTKLEKEFEEKTGIELDITGAASGTLTAQIQNGAPYHVFISANEAFPNYLFENNLSSQPPEVLAHGSLVAFTGVAVRDEAELIQYLSSPACSSIALPNPDIAPYGAAARTWLQEEGLWKSLKPKFVFGESVGKVNTLIFAQSVQAGFTSNSAQFTPELQELGEWVPLEWTDPVPQFAIKLKTDHPDKQVLWNFLLSTEAKGIFKKYGYTF